MDQLNNVFWEAAANDDFAAICAEIKKGTNINYQNGDGRTALMRSAKRGYKDIVRVLLDNDADVNLEDNNGKTAIMGAAKKGHRTIVKKLIEAGADVNKQDDR
ncbi:MAG: ankyrin repeat domain-containing protein, partial [Erysipelotrichaceae bacterium]